MASFQTFNLASTSLLNSFSSFSFTTPFFLGLTSPFGSFACVGLGRPQGGFTSCRHRSLKKLPSEKLSNGVFQTFSLTFTSPPTLFQVFTEYFFRLFFSVFCPFYHMVERRSPYQYRDTSVKLLSTRAEEVHPSRVFHH